MISKRAALIWYLRVFGGTMLLALPFVFIPTPWMAGIHEWLGLGPFPDGPITEYLARSLSAFYAGAGAAVFFFSTDVTRYRPAILLFARASVALSLVLLWIDLKVGMPTSWTWSEGPFVFPLGLILWWLASGADRPAVRA
jgi:hypothetical protein